MLASIRSSSNRTNCLQSHGIARPCLGTAPLDINCQPWVSFLIWSQSRCLGSLRGQVHPSPGFNTKQLLDSHPPEVGAPELCY